MVASVPYSTQHPSEEIPTSRENAKRELPLHLTLINARKLWVFLPPF